MFAFYFGLYSITAETNCMFPHIYLSFFNRTQRLEMTFSFKTKKALRSNFFKTVDFEFINILPHPYCLLGHVPVLFDPKETVNRKYQIGKPFVKSR